MLGNPPQLNASDAGEPPELSPLWGLTLVLGEIALRVEREQANGPGSESEQDVRLSLRGNLPSRHHTSKGKDP